MAHSTRHLRHFVAVETVADSPIFGLRPRWLHVVQIAWQPLDPQPERLYPTASWVRSVDRPTPRRPYPIGIIGAWRDPDPAPDRAYPRASWLISIEPPPVYTPYPIRAILAWQDPDPQPQTKVRWYTAGSGPPATLPFELRKTAELSALRGQESLRGTANPLAGQDPIFGLRPRWLSAVLSAWQDPDPQPPIGRHSPLDVTAVPEDSPIFGLRPRWFSAVYDAWSVDTGPQVQRNTPDAGWLPSVDDPFFRVPYPIHSVLAWQDPDPMPTNYHPSAAWVLSVDDPSWGVHPKWLYNVLLAWQPPDPMPPVGVHGPLDITAVPVNDPLFGLHPRWLDRVLGAWEPPDPLPAQKPAWIGWYVNPVSPFGGSNQRYYQH